MSQAEYRITYTVRRSDRARHARIVVDADGVEVVIPLEDGGSVPYLGRELTLRVRVEPGRVRSHVALRGDELRVAVGEPGRRALRDALEAWYRRRARGEVAPRLDAACARAGTNYRRLTI